MGLRPVRIAHRNAGTCLQAGLRARERGFPCLSPSHAHAQWLRDRLVLAYRCGGSAGIVIRQTHRLPECHPRR